MEQPEETEPTYNPDADPPPTDAYPQYSQAAAGLAALDAPSGVTIKWNGHLKKSEPETVLQRMEARHAQAVREEARLAELCDLLRKNPTTERILSLMNS